MNRRVVYLESFPPMFMQELARGDGSDFLAGCCLSLSREGWHFQLGYLLRARRGGGAWISHTNWDFGTVRLRLPEGDGVRCTEFGGWFWVRLLRVSVVELIWGWGARRVNMEGSKLMENVKLNRTAKITETSLWGAAVAERSSGTNESPREMQRADVFQQNQFGYRISRVTLQRKR
jgi:hypothetical protein